MADALGNFYFAKNHPMKPPRLAMTHHLILGYQLHEKMDVFVSRRLSLCTGLGHFSCPRATA